MASLLLSIRSFLFSRSFAILIVGLSVPLLYQSSPSYMRIIWHSATSNIMSSFSPINTSSSTRPPVYFLSIGGPNFVENPDHPAYHALARVGLEITQNIKPKAVVVFSAHWQGGPRKVLINVAEETELIYDFYGFPKHYYELEYPNRGSRDVAERVIERLARADIEVDRTERGMDHGVWVGFMTAFDPKTNPLNVPIIQVSLFDNEDPDEHYRLGQALESLRDEGILIIGTGMAVHNLRDYGRTMGTGEPMPYAITFDEALKDATTAPPEDRQAKMAALLKRSDARKAHPSMEHLLPIHIAAGAAGADVGERLFTLPEGSLSWAQYRFGDVAAA